MLNTYHLSKSTAATTGAQPTRYAVRQVLDQELRKEKILQSSLASQKRSGGLFTIAQTEHGEDKENKDPVSAQTRKVSDVKRDFFGRIIAEERTGSPAERETKKSLMGNVGKGERVWVSFNEGFSNAVRKPITLKELMDGF